VLSHTLQFLNKNFFIGGVGWIGSKMVSGKLEEPLAGYQGVGIDHEHRDKDAPLIVRLYAEAADAAAEPRLVRIEFWKSNLGTNDTSQLAVGDKTTML
jgi:hypothetical protein